MSSDQSVFTFELNETLYFERGQEVEELRGISLDPEISIQALDDYISITGVIELNGNYHKVEVLEESQEPLDEFQSEVKRFIDNVEVTGENEAEFIHRFPVEISVPTYRVNSLDDVAVSVESFDYELPNNSQLKLYSTIAIHGINQEVGSREEAIEEEETVELEEQADVREEPDFLEIEEDTFEFEIKQTEEAKENEELEVPSIIEPPILADERQDIEEIDEEEEEKEEETQEGRWAFKTQSQSLSEFFAKKDETKIDENESDDIETEEYDDEADSETEIVYENRTDSKDESDVTYLSDIFRETKEEEFTKMRLCIVQKDDTIETISERFEVSPLQVIKQNQLDDDFDVSEGQVLYIPSKK